MVQKIQSDYHYARVEYESDEGKGFMEWYQLSGFPNLIVLDGQGTAMHRIPLSFSPEPFLGLL